LRSVLRLVCLGTLPLFLASCCTTPTLMGQLPDPPPFTLRPGDEIEVRFTYFPELTDTQVIRPDGKVSLQLIGAVHVADLTPEDVSWLLKNLYEEKIRDPELVVIVRTLGNNRVFLGGEALLPGAIDYRPGMTVMDALMEAGGWVLDTAMPSKVAVFRTDPETGARVGRTIDVEREIKSSHSKPIYLAANDIIYIPESDVSNANRWIDQHLTQMVPGLGASVSESRGSSAVGLGFSL